MAPSGKEAPGAMAGSRHLHRAFSRLLRDTAPSAQTARPRGAPARRSPPSAALIDDTSARVTTWAKANGVSKELNRAVADRDMTQVQKRLVQTWESDPFNPNLRAMVARTGVAPAPGGRVLESLVYKSQGFEEVDAWMQRMTQRLFAVCRMECDDAPEGTGFLVGKDLVLTNFHVVRPALEALPGPHTRTVRLRNGSLTARFDFRRSADGTRLFEGRVYSASAEVLAWSPDTEAGLDFALLQLTKPAGTDRVGGQSSNPQRLWLAPEAYQFAGGETVYIIQHPRAASLRFATGPYVDAAPPFIHYKVNTEPGSSGSPCFNQALVLAALHQGSERNKALNSGIRFGDILPKIRRFLEALPARPSQAVARLPLDEGAGRPLEGERGGVTPRLERNLATAAEPAVQLRAEFRLAHGKPACSDPRGGWKLVLRVEGLPDEEGSQVAFTLRHYFGEDEHWTESVGVDDRFRLAFMSSRELPIVARIKWPRHQLVIRGLLSELLKASYPHANRAIREAIEDIEQN